MKQNKAVTRDTIREHINKSLVTKGMFGKPDVLRRYFNEIRSYPLLTRQEELELSTQYQQSRDPWIAYRLVTSNLRLVVKIAFEFSGYTNSILDLIQEGNLGLLHAIKRYDPERGVRLSSYARYWIRSYIIYFLLNNYRLIKVGTTQAQRKLFFNLKKERARLAALGIDPTAQRLAKSFDLPEKTVVEMQGRLDNPELSTDAPCRDSASTLGDLLSGGSSPEDTVYRSEVKDMVNKKIREFGTTLSSDRDKTIWRQRFVAESPKTLQQLGDSFGISRERVRQLAARIKRRLRNYLTDEFGEHTIKVDFLEALN